MDKFTSLTAVAAPLFWANVNTDDIFPGPGASPVGRDRDRRHALAERETMGINAFAVYRWNDDLSPKPDFILNQPRYADARILIARANFGCGSSREMAVWALQGIGIRVVIAPSFGDIFHGNCFKCGMLPIRLPEEEIERLLDLMANGPDPRLTIDLEAQHIVTPDGATIGFEIGAYQREMLLGGLDEIANTLAREGRIAAFETEYRATRPWLADAA